MKFGTVVRAAWAMLWLAGAVGAGAQTLATGDARTVTEPAFPASCTVLTAQQAMVAGAPASETLYDTSRIQAALTACPSGQAVELASGGGNSAFLSATLNLPSGVSLIVDGGVTLFASRRASDYQVSSTTEACGSFGASGNGCTNFLTFNKGSSNTGSGIYGYGVIDLRGGSTILDSTGADTGISWWTNADQATTAGKSQDNLVFMKPSRSTNLTLYKITIRNSPMFHVVTSGVSGMTVWGVKIQAPYTAHNTDGIDPQGTNVTITNTSISDGDDGIAVSASSASSNITVSNTTIYSSHGISVGSYTQGGLNNFLVKNVNMAGEPADGNQNGLRLKSALDRGGLVQNVTYQNICMRDIYRPIYVTPLYNSNAGTLIPTFSNIVYQNIHVLPTTKTTRYYASIAGNDASHPSTVTLDNVVFDQAPTFSPAWTYDTVTLLDNQYPASLTTQNGTGLTYAGTPNVTAAGAYDCSATAKVFPFIVGELFGSTATATNLQTATIAGGASVTLNAMVQPAKSQTSFAGTVGSYIGTPALTQAVNFYEGTTLVGSGVLGANGTNNSLASLTLSGVTPGPHTYTAQYPGDSNYNMLSFGSVTVTVTGASTASTTTLTAPATGTYGTAVTLSAKVTGSGGTPSGSVAFYDGSSLLGSGMLTAGNASLQVTLGGGPHSLKAVYGGDAVFVTSNSTVSTLTVALASSATTVTVSPSPANAEGTTTLTATVTGVSGASTPTGTVTFTDGTSAFGSGTVNSAGSVALTVTLPVAGTRTVTASYGGDANYAASSGTTSVVYAAITTTVLSVAPTAVYGAGVTASATVSSNAGTPAGTVTLTDANGGGASVGSIALSGGTGATSLQLSGGAHVLTASYGGQASVFSASSSAASTLTVTPAASSMALVPAAANVALNATDKLTVTVTGVSGGAAPSGTVTITDGNTTLGTITLSGGTGSVTPTLAMAGARTLKASYSGDGNYAASTVTTIVTVAQAASTTTITAASSTVQVNATDMVTVTVAGVSGVAVPTGTVTVMDGSATLGTITLSGGSGTLTPALATVGSRTLTAQYGGDSNYTASSGTVAVTVTQPTTTTLGISPASAYTGATVTLTATVSPVPSGGTVTFSNGASVSVNITTGVASTTLTAGTSGSFTYTASFSGSGVYTASSSVSQTLTVAAPVSLNAAKTALTVLPGSSGTVALNVVSGGGYAGSVTLTCASPVSYVTCTVAPASVTPGAAGTSSVTGTVTVAATTSLLERSRNGIELAMLAPLGMLLFGLRRRAARVRVERCAIALIAAVGLCSMAALAGCGGSASSVGSGGGSAVNKPSGSQTVVFTAAANGVTQSTSIVVSFQ